MSKLTNTDGRYRRQVPRTLLGVSVLLALSLVLSWSVGGKLVAPSFQNVGRSPTELPAESVSFESSSGSAVSAWSVPASPSRGVIVLLHGIRGSRLSMLERAKFLHNAGYSIVLLDHQAHGETPGEAITLGYLEKHDVEAAVAFVRERYPGERIAVIGVSLGGASALLSSPLGINALILEAVYPTIEEAVYNRVAAKLGPLASIPTEVLLIQLKVRLGISRADLRPIDFISKVECPVFIISGIEDLHTTAQETKRMYEQAMQPKELWLIDGAAHQDLHRLTPGLYKKKVLAFLGRYMAH